MDDAIIVRRHRSRRHDEFQKHKLTVFLCERCTMFFPTNDPHREIPRWPLVRNDYANRRIFTLEGLNENYDKCSLCTLIRINSFDLSRAAIRDAENLECFTIDWTKSGVRPPRRQSGPSSRPVEVYTVAIWPKPSHSAKGLWLRPCANPVPTVRAYCQAEKPLAAHQRTSRLGGRLIDRQADIRLLQRWLSLCDTHHGTQCESPDWLLPHEYPKSLRLIDIASMALIDATESHRYVTLSYVWGLRSQPELNLVSDNIQTLKQPNSLVLSNLPKTFRNTIQLLRDLGERYLWIDALCILQDDPVDTDFHIAQMDLIYARSRLTIVAGYGDSVHAGLPHIYEPTRTIRQDYVAISPDLCLMEDVSNGMYGPQDSKWLFRGWTYQENILSRRVIFFLKDQIHWRCEVDYWCEDTCLEPCHGSLNPCKYKLGTSLGLVAGRQRFGLDSLQYHIYAYNFSKEFTYEHDCIRAFQGILNRISKFAHVDFHWGIPTKHFTQNLLWRDNQFSGFRPNMRREHQVPIRQPTGTVESLSIPSWSWMGWRTRIAKAPPYEVDSDTLYDDEKIYDHAQFTADRTPGLVWSSSWYRRGLHRELAEIDPTEVYDSLSSSSSSGGEEDTIAASSPPWTGLPDLSKFELKSEPFADSGKICAWTSHAKIRVRPQLVVWPAILKGQSSDATHSFNVLDDNFEVIGTMRAVDMITPQARPWSFETFLAVADADQKRDFIVISATQGESTRHDPYESTDEEIDLPTRVLINRWLGKQPMEQPVNAGVAQPGNRESPDTSIDAQQDTDPGDPFGHQILPTKGLAPLPDHLVQRRVEDRLKKLGKSRLRQQNVLNVMMVEFGGSQSEPVASRVALFTIGEDLWMRFQPQWEFVTLG